MSALFQNKKARVRAVGNSLPDCFSDNCWYANASEVQAWFKTVYENPLAFGYSEIEIVFYRGELRRWNSSTNEWEVSGRLANGTVYWMYVATPFDESLDMNEVDFISLDHLS